MSSHHINLGPWIREELRIDPDSPTGLVWNLSKFRVTEGTPAGYLETRTGTYFIRLCKRRFVCARLVYYLSRGEDPGRARIKFHDGDKHNLHPDNLYI